MSHAMEHNPILSINIKVWKFFAVVLKRNNNVLYPFIASVAIMNSLQIVFLYEKCGDISSFILNLFFASAIFNGLLRTTTVILNREHFEEFMHELNELYMELQLNTDDYVQDVLAIVTKSARKISMFNLLTAFCNIICTLILPFFNEDRIHPVGVAVPGLNMTASPTYEIFYILEMPSPVILSAIYMPFVSFFASCTMFGTAMLKILRYKIRIIDIDTHANANALHLFAKLRACIIYYMRIQRYVRKLSALVRYIVLVEFILFSCIICTLLFCLNMTTFGYEFATMILFILTILYVLFSYYWQANELLLESLKVSEAVYLMNSWYCSDKRFRSTVLLFLQCTQSPLQITLGTLYPMTLGTFQSLLNKSYSYFTILKGTYKK